MRPARAAPGVPFVNLPLRQSPNACAGDCRGIFDPVVPYKPPRLTAHLTCSNLALAVVNMTLIAMARFSRPVTCAPQTPHRLLRHRGGSIYLRCPTDRTHSAYRPGSINASPSRPAGELSPVLTWRRAQSYDVIGVGNCSCAKSAGQVRRGIGAG